MNDSLKAELNRETAKIPWKDLQRFFAAGNAIYVGSNLDLIDVAIACQQDNAQSLKFWMDAGHVHNVNDQQALDWLEQDKTVWAVVIAPWVLIQDVR